MPSIFLRLFPYSFFCASYLLAQSEVGTAILGGTVTDPSGATVAGAKVTAVNQATGFTRTTETNEAGQYTLLRLAVGRYDLTVDLQGFKTAKKTGVLLNVGAVANLDVALEIGAATESVSVTAEIPVIESTRSQTSTTVNEKAVSDLPINGRNFLDFATLTPGVMRDPSRGGDLSFGGQKGTANTLLVDGGDSNNLFFGQSAGRAGGGRNPYSFSQDSVQEFQVVNSGYSAETGRAAGGVINVVTKSGTNDLHGAAFWFFRDKALNANKFTQNARGIRKQPYHFNQFGGNVGGPIKKGKAFFFFDYDGQRNRNPNALFFPVPPPNDPLSQQAAEELSKYQTPYTREFNNNIYLVKTDYNLGPNDRLTVRYNAHRFNGKNLENSGAQSAAEHTGDSNITTDNITATYTKVLGGRLVWDSRFIFLRDNEPGFANSNAPEAQVRQNNTLVMTVGRNNFSPRYTNAKRYQIVESAAYSRSRHTFKFGVDLNFERIGNFFPGNFGGSYQFNSYADFAARRPISFTQAFAGEGTNGALTQPNINEYAFYFQDDWRATERLTLNYGVRYDLMDSANPQVKNPDPGLAAAGLDTSRLKLDTNNLAARFGFAYRLTGSDRIVLRGGYGNFYGRTPAIMTGTAHSQNGIQVQTYTIRANFPSYPNVLSAPPAAGRTPDIYVFAPDYVQPLTHQWSLNLETALGRDYSVTLGYLGVRGAHLSRTRDINFFPAQLTAGRIANGSDVQFFRHPLVRPNLNFGRISLFDSGGDSVYHGGFVQLNKRFSQNFQLLASFTLAKVIDTVPDQTSVVVGTGDDAKVAQNTLLPNLDRGRGEADIRKRFVLSGVWDLPYARSLSNAVARAILRDYQLSVIGTAQSGIPFSPTVSGDPDGNGNGRTDRPPLLGRNTMQGPGFAGLDVRLSRDIPLYQERVKLRLIFEAFNSTNRVNFSSWNRGQYGFANGVFTPLANFLANTDTSDPRILQLAAKITF